MTDIIAFCAERVPKWNTISISGYHMREAGSTAVQEVAFTLANGLAYVQAALDRGLGIDEFAPRLSFFFNAHNNFLEEVAKFRAARRLWAELVRERFAPKDPRSLWLRFHTQTAGSTLTAQQPQNNVVRVAIQALAAVCGGTQSLHTNSLDEALGLPTEEAARLALRTQQVIAHESGVADVADPLGGSYVIEAWTEEIVQRSRDYIRRIDEMGGALAGAGAGVPAEGDRRRRLPATRWRSRRSGRSWWGSTPSPREEELPTEVLRIDPAAEREQVERLRALRERRNPGAPPPTLTRPATAAREDRNLMPAILDCVRAEVTLGEISDALRGVYGEYREAGWSRRTAFPHSPPSLLQSHRNIRIQEDARPRCPRPDGFPVAMRSRTSICPAAPAHGGAAAAARKPGRRPDLALAFLPPEDACATPWRR